MAALYRLMRRNFSFSGALTTLPQSVSSVLKAVAEASSGVDFFMATSSPRSFSPTDTERMTGLFSDWRGGRRRGRCVSGGGVRGPRSTVLGSFSM